MDYESKYGIVFNTKWLLNKSSTFKQIAQNLYFTYNVYRFQFQWLLE